MTTGVVPAAIRVGGVDPAPGRGSVEKSRVPGVSPSPWVRPPATAAAAAAMAAADDDSGAVPSRAQGDKQRKAR